MEPFNETLAFVWHPLISLWKAELRKRYAAGHSPQTVCFIALLLLQPLMRIPVP